MRINHEYNMCIVYRKPTMLSRQPSSLSLVSLCVKRTCAWKHTHAHKERDTANEPHDTRRATMLGDQSNALIGRHAQSAICGWMDGLSGCSFWVGMVHSLSHVLCLINWNRNVYAYSFCARPPSCAHHFAAALNTLFMSCRDGVQYLYTNNISRNCVEHLWW